MGLSTYLKNISSITSALPAAFSGFVTLADARQALQAGAADRVLELAEKGLSDLAAKTPADAAPGVFGDAIRAALSALAALALHKLERDPARSQKLFQAADAAFTAFMRNGSLAAMPFFSEYIAMLAEFEATDRALDVAEYLRSTAQRPTSGLGGAFLQTLRLSAAAPAVRTIMDLGRTLRNDNPEGAFEAYMHAAAIAFGRNDAALALEAIENALEIHPDNAAALSVRGTLRWRAGQIREAAEDFAGAVAGNPEDLDSRVALARAQIELRQPEKALDQLAFVLDKQPRHTDALWLRGMAELRIGEAQASTDLDASRAHWKAAIASFSTALEAKPDHSACRRSRGIAYHHLEMWDEALQDLDEAAKSDPNDVEGQGWRAAVLLARKQYEDAIAAANVALALIGKDSRAESKRPWLLGIRGRALLAADFPDQAIATFKEALPLDPGNEDLARAILEAYASKRDWAGLASAACDSQSSQFFSAAFRLILRKLEIAALRNARSFDAAFAAFKREPLPPLDDPEVTWLLARLLSDIGDFEEAYRILPERANNAPGAVDQISLRGWVVQNLEPADRAHREELGREGLRLYKAALAPGEKESQNKADQIWLLKGQANALLRSGDKNAADLVYGQVIAVCERTLREFKPNSRVFALAGWCHHSMGDHASAINFYENAMNLGDATIAVEFDYALVLAAAGIGQSLERYQNAIRRAEGEHVLRRIGLLRVALHDLRETSFRNAQLRESGEIWKCLDGALHGALELATAAPDGFKDRITSFLAVVAGALSPQFSGQPGAPAR
jgi:tetratricopeptide (TPR) repeat protein